MTLSRRAFLELCGVVTTGILMRQPLASAMPTSLSACGRVLRSKADANGSWAYKDTVVEFVHMRDGRLKIARPYDWLDLRDVQLMPGYDAHEVTQVPAGFPSLMQVCAPSTLAYQTCSVESDPTAHLGYGAGAWAVDALPSLACGTPAWLLMADDSQTIGWSQAHHWRAVAETPRADAPCHIVIRPEDQRLFIVDDGGDAGQFDIACDDSSARRSSVVTGHSILTRCDTPGTLSWCLLLEDGRRIGGADWHHAFGQTQPSQDVHLHPFAARLLFEQVATGSTVEFQ